MKKLFTTPFGKLCLISILFLLPYKQLLAQSFFYYAGTGALNNTASWGTNTDGTGTPPADFITANQIFIIQNTTNIIFNTGTWTVSGTGTKVHLGNPTTATPNTPSPAITLTIAAGNTINTTGQLFDVAIPSSGNHKIVYQNTTPISVGTINDSNLEIVYDGAVFATSTSRIYGNISLINGASIDLSGATNGPTCNNLTIEAGCTLTGPVGGSNTWIGIKASGIVTINGTLKAGRAGGLFTANVAFPVVNSTSNATLLFNSPTVTQGTNLILGPASTIDFYRGTTGQIGAQTIQALNYGNLTFSNFAVASNKTFATGSTTISGTFTINILGTITVPTTQNITLKPGARLLINSATSFPTPTGTGKFTLESDATGTASIGTLFAGASITGVVNIQRFIPGSFRKYRFLSHPFSANQPLSQLTDDIDITGNTAGTTGLPGQVLGTGFTATPTNNPSAYYFNTATADGASPNDAGWLAFIDNTTTTNWPSGKGVRVLVRGSKGQANTLDGTDATPDPVTLTMSGTVNVGAVAVPMVNTATGLNLMGIPYASPVDIGAVLTAATPGTNIANAFYLRNPQTESFITVSPIPASYVIPAYSAFFVQALTASNLNFAESNKSTCVTCPTVFRTTNTGNRLELKAYKDGLEYDNMIINEDATNSNSYDKKNDAIKLMNNGFNIYALSADNFKLAANFVKKSKNTIIPLGVSSPKNSGIQTYQLKVADYTFTNGTKVLLHDKLSNHYTLLQKDKEYNLTVDPANKNSIGENRLELIIEN